MLFLLDVSMMYFDKIVLILIHIVMAQESNAFTNLFNKLSLIETPPI